MAASIQPEIDKKLLKKMRKHQQMLVSREKMKVIDTPSPILCVSNGGLENGVAYEEIHPLFSAHGRCDVIMIPKKSYCIVCFASSGDGVAAYNMLNGHKLVADENRKTEVTLYLAFIEKAPECLTQSTERPPGLVLLEDFVSQEYADEIVQSVDWNDSPTSANQKELKHRRVKHYGYEFKYSINNVDPDDPLLDGIPEVYRPLLEKLLAGGHVKHYPDQLTVNQYLPGQGIPPHVDTPSAFEDGLVSLSIGSQVIMEFRHPDGRQLSVLLPNRSALVMTGESRYIWSHGITPRKSDIISTSDGGLTLSNRGLRTSFTFRKITGVKPGEEISGNLHIPLNEDSAAQLESHHVHKVYEEIADHFSGTRHTPWPRIADFLKEQPLGSVLVDIGCGNGKYFGINKQLYELGSDRSCNLAGICQQRGFEVFVGDVLSIPVRSGACDVCLCIAVIHHLSTQERRVKAVSELLRILRPKGKALIYVWAMEQELNKVKSKYLKGKKQVKAEAGAGITDETNATGVSANEGRFSTECTGQESKGNEQNSLDDRTEANCFCNERSDRVKNNDGNSENKDSAVTEIDGEKENSGIKNLPENSSETENDEIENIAALDSTHVEKVSGVLGPEKRNTCTENKDDKHISLTAENGKSVKECGENFKSLKLENVDKDIGNELRQPLVVHVNRTEFKQQDLLVPWQLKKKDNPKDVETYHRFYHVFQKGELEDLCLKAGKCRVKDSYYDQGNWAVILEKL